MEALGEGVDHRSASVGRTSGQVTGIALRGTVEPITLQAGQAALSAELSRMSQLVGLRATCHDQEALALAAVVALDGNLVTGFAPGQAATSTTLLVGWNVTDATLQGTPVTNLHIEHKFSNFGNCSLRTELRREGISSYDIPSYFFFFSSTTFVFLFFFWCYLGCLSEAWLNIHAHIRLFCSACCYN